MLYWFTQLTETTPMMVETAMAGGVSTLNSYQTQPSTNTDFGVPYQSQYSSQGVGGQRSNAGQQYSQNQYNLKRFEEGFHLDFKPWLAENHLGGQAWYGKFLPDKQHVAVKCWDAYMDGSAKRDKEADSYMRIQSLWGVCVPIFFGKGEIDFCHAIFLERIDVRKFFTYL
jgi:hypothetical protein